MNHNLQKIISTYNKVFWLMYYDELIIRQGYELSYLQGADQMYYNAIHALCLADKTTLDCIEADCFNKGITPAIYLDPSSYAFHDVLTARGYVENTNNKECWYRADLQNTKDLDETFVHPFTTLPPQMAMREISRFDTGALNTFLEIDARANHIPSSIREKMRDHIQTRSDPIIHNHYFILSVNGQPATIGSVAICHDWAFFAEGGTLESYQRQGLYTHLLCESLRFARKQGCQYAFIICDAQAFSNAAALKVGFHFYFQRQLLYKPPKQ